MATTTLEATARALVAPGEGILAADESHATIGRRFEPLGIANTEENRRRYRQMLLTTKGISEFISGVILFDETIRQATTDGRR
jgi:fructose-bisphosphate aldolase, class I